MNGKVNGVGYRGIGDIIGVPDNDPVFSNANGKMEIGEEERFDP